jgi:hypothetical protein
MTYKRDCKQCGNPFEANRQDAIFCSGKCTAKYYRDNDNPDYTHAYKQHIHWFVCDECGQGYVVNDYAKRGGKRAPRFCSVKCKQKAYRSRVKQQAARRQEQNTKPGDDNQQQRERANAGQQKQQRDQQQKHRTRRDTRDPYVILGVSHSDTNAAIRKAWLRLIKKWHPDANPDNLEQATRMSQDINWAYETLCK